VDSITQTKPSSFQFPTLELGLTGSCRYRDEINSKNKLNGTFLMPLHPLIKSAAINLKTYDW
jgi:hypothetical protein